MGNIKKGAIMKTGKSQAWTIMTCLKRNCCFTLFYSSVYFNSSRVWSFRVWNVFSVWKRLFIMNNATIEHLTHSTVGSQIDAADVFNKQQQQPTWLIHWTSSWRIWKSTVCFSTRIWHSKYSIILNININILGELLECECQTLSQLLNIPTAGLSFPKHTCPTVPPPLQSVITIYFFSKKHLFAGICIYFAKHESRSKMETKVLDWSLISLPLFFTLTYW